MSRKSVKSRSTDPFEKETGIILYPYLHERGCLIAPIERTLHDGKQERVKNVAASIYLQKPISEVGEVTQSCECKNCVLPAHLLVNGKNLTTDFEGRLKSNEINDDAPDKNGDIHGCHPSIWEQMNDYQKSLVRSGQYNQTNVFYQVEPPKV